VKLKHRKHDQTYYVARETAREDAIDGLPLASFWQRAAGFSIDFVLISMIRKPAGYIWKIYAPHDWQLHTLVNLPHLLDLIVLILYFSLALYLGRGQTIGKRIARTRVISLTQERVSLWQSLERAIGYGASFLELGFGFVQFFLNRNRQCAHDRLAETVVVDMSGSSPVVRVDSTTVSNTSSPRSETPVNEAPAAPETQGDPDLRTRSSGSVGECPAKFPVNT
jgi:uncharacterized RDD family membrane protein YckC